MRIVPITPPPESNRLRYSASAELALAEPASAEPRPRLYPHHSDCPIHQNRTTVVHFHPLHCPIHQNRTHWHAILRAHQRTDPSPHPKSAVRIPQAACYSPGPRRTRHPPADTASPQPSARILPTFPTDHAPTDTATSPENRQYRSQRQSTAPQSHASPAFCRERDVVDAFRRQRQSPLRTTESDFPTKVDHPSEPLRVTANDRHAIPPFPPSHATVPSPTSFRSTRSSSSMRNACFAINSSHWLMMSCAWASCESASCDSVADDCASSRIRS